MQGYFLTVLLITWVNEHLTISPTTGYRSDQAAHLMGMWTTDTCSGDHSASMDQAVKVFWSANVKDQAMKINWYRSVLHQLKRHCCNERPLKYTTGYKIFTIFPIHYTLSQVVEYISLYLTTGGLISSVLSLEQDQYHLKHDGLFTNTHIHTQQNVHTLKGSQHIISYIWNRSTASVILRYFLYTHTQTHTQSERTNQKHILSICVSVFLIFFPL